MSSAVDQIKSRLSISDVVGSYIRIEKAGVNYKARCPFHSERTPSFFVSPPRGTFHCFGCGKGGDIFTFVQEIEAIEFKAALELLAERAGVTIPEFNTKERSERGTLLAILEAAALFYESVLSENTLAKEYLTSRGVSPDSIRNWSIGFAPESWRSLLEYLEKKGFRRADIAKAGLAIVGEKSTYDRFRSRIMFPIKNHTGAVIGFSGRIFGDAPEGQGKYVNSPATPVFDKSRVLYGIDRAKRAIREKGECILVEGQMDVILAHQAGTENVVGVSGTALTPLHLQILSGHTDKVIFVLDSDNAGFKASERGVSLAVKEGMHVTVVPLPKGSDPADIAGKTPQVWNSLVQMAKPFVRYALEMIEGTAGGPRERAVLVRSFLYPHIRSIAFPLDRDHALRQVADALGENYDSTREDFETWKSKNPVADENTPNAPSLVEIQDENTRKKMIADRVSGVILWQESLPNPEIPIAEAYAKWKEVMGKEWEDEKKNLDHTPEKKGSLVFLAESYYSNAKLSHELHELFLSLEEEILKQELEDALKNLRQAERSKRSDHIETYLRICQRITEKLQALRSKS